MNTTQKAKLKARLIDAVFPKLRHRNERLVALSLDEVGVKRKEVAGGFMLFEMANRVGKSFWQEEATREFLARVRAQDWDYFRSLGDLVKRAKLIRAEVGLAWWEFTPGRRRCATSVGVATLLRNNPKISLQEVEAMLDDIGIIPKRAHLRRVYNGHRRKKPAKGEAGRLTRTAE